jgi:hypothetical protein
MVILTRSQILPPSDIHGTLLASGIKDCDIRNGSIALGRVNCCGGPTERQEAILFYIPPDVPGVEFRDIVEVRSVAEQRQKATGWVNTMTRIRQKHSDAFDRWLAYGQCRWDPPDLQLNLWLRGATEARVGRGATSVVQAALQLKKPSSEALEAPRYTRVRDSSVVVKGPGPRGSRVACRETSRGAR